MARPFAAFVVALLGAGTASAHHSRVNFLHETVAFDGEIVRFDWANPHSHIYVAGHDSSGRPVEWEIESSSTPVLTRRVGSRPCGRRPAASCQGSFRRLANVRCARRRPGHCPWSARSAGDDVAVDP
jgi:hypothetical protein